MTFAVFLPPAALSGGSGAGGGVAASVPITWFLSGLTCTWENFSTKAGAFEHAARCNVALVMPDTSPRGAGVEGEAEHWDFGVGAGFYVDATTAKWAAHYRMHTYVTEELPALVCSHFPVLDGSRQSVMGHSMGGLGALTAALKHPGRYRVASAFSPIAHPSVCGWGIKAFSGYLGEDKSAWAAYDPTELIKSYKGPDLHIRIDQGDADEWLTKGQLRPDDFLAAAGEAGVEVDYHLQPGYDHSYFFIATFIRDHIELHARHLAAGESKA